MRAVLKYVRCRQRALQRGGPRAVTRVRERTLRWLFYPGLWSQRRGKFLGPAGFKVGADFRTNFPRSLSRGKRGTRARAAELPSCTLPPSRHLSGPWEGGGPLSWQSHWLSGLELWLGRRDVTSSSEGLLLSPLPSRLEGGTEVLLKLNNKANVIYLRYMVMWTK